MSGPVGHPSHGSAPVNPEAPLERAAEVDDAPLVVALVLGIARLGEVGLKGWWQSYGIGDTGRYVLHSAFRRTGQVSGLELDVLSAARRQKEHLARPTARHLFSDYLPFRRLGLAWLAERKTAEPSTLITRLARWDLDTALRDLTEWTSGAVPEGEIRGPGLWLGMLQPADLVSTRKEESVAKHLTAAYLELKDELRTPYFDFAA